MTSCPEYCLVQEMMHFSSVQYSAASFIETISSNSLTMDADEFVARMVAAGIPDMQFLPEVQSNAAPPSQLPRVSSLMSDTNSAYCALSKAGQQCGKSY